jgi:serine/threonine-protein kinase RsbW
VLAVSEPASNCVEHAYSPATVDDVVELNVWTEPRAVCIQVIDHGEWPLRATNPPDGARGS